MSITLTDRDAGTEVFTASQLDADGVTFASASSTTTSVRTLKVRHQGAASAKPRVNRQLLLRKVDAATGRVGFIQVDHTLKVVNPEMFTADEIDDVDTKVTTFAKSEGNVLGLLNGLVPVNDA